MNDDGPINACAPSPAPIWPTDLDLERILDELAAAPTVENVQTTVPLIRAMLDKAYIRGRKDAVLDRAAKPAAASVMSAPGGSGGRAGGISCASGWPSPSAVTFTFGGRSDPPDDPGLVFSVTVDPEPLPGGGAARLRVHGDSGGYARFGG